MNLLPENLSPLPLKANSQIVNHVFDKNAISAINAAIAINRPLLIWGEPGIGKSQLARAVAQQLERVFIPFVCDAHTESRDLLWSFDAVARLAEAQIQGSAESEIRQKVLAIENFIKPQALWWALNWVSAKAYDDEPPYTAPCHPNNGSVILIDEIDKADTDVPNGLLEVLGSQRFQPQGMDSVEAGDQAKPIIIITTNNERHLPDAFLRRCLSLHLEFPANNERDKEKREQAQKRFLIGRSKAQDSLKDLDDAVIDQAAQMLIEDRQIAKDEHLYPLCGQAEFFDLLRGVKQLSENQERPAQELIEELRLYVYQKHPLFPRQAVR